MPSSVERMRMGKGGASVLWLFLGIREAEQARHTAAGLGSVKLFSCSLLPTATHFPRKSGHN